MKIGFGLAGLFCLLTSVQVAGQFQRVIDLEQPPFEYSTKVGVNRVSRVLEKLRSNELELNYAPPQGNLRALLSALEIPESSQVLVFSKTSMQVRYISSRNPRALYFNDDTYVGWVHGSSLVEISTADPQLGTAFYTIDMSPTRPRLQQAYYDCLACHATTLTQGIPGHTIRSVMPTYDGSVDPRRPAFITDDTSPFDERWGGWYVTGLHGNLPHLGNAVLRGDRLDTSGNGNRLNLRDEFDTSHYLSPYSDIVALMVLEHQTQMHNSLVRADFFVRQLQFETDGDSATLETQAERQEQLRLIATEVVDRLLFHQAAPLTAEIQGLEMFQQEFTSRGPRDSTGRSLRDFDLHTRLFAFPCSYLIYSAAFEALQPALKQEIYRQMLHILSADGAREPSADDGFSHLTPKIRGDILQILRETKADWPR